MMDVVEAIRTMLAVRRYQGTPVPEAVRDAAAAERRTGAAGLSGRTNDFIMQIRASRRSLIVELDRAVLEARVLPAFAERHFPERGSDRYRVAIVDAGRKTVWTQGLPAGASIAATRSSVGKTIGSLSVQLLSRNSCWRLSSVSASTSLGVERS